MSLIGIIASQNYPRGVIADIMVIAGGGGGGDPVGGGGGAGGFQVFTNESLTPSTTYTITVGGGGAENTNGVNTSFGALTASVGGGKGGTFT